MRPKRFDLFEQSRTIQKKFNFQTRLTNATADRYLYRSIEIVTIHKKFYRDINFYSDKRFNLDTHAQNFEDIERGNHFCILRVCIGVKFYPQTPTQTFNIKKI